MDSVTLSVEGNIGSGKSTLLEYLKENFKFDKWKIIFLQEPVEEWKTITDNSGKNIIEKYYSNQERYAFSFQMMAYITRLSQITKTLKENPKNTIIITERCLFTDRNIFAKMLFDSGKIEEIEYSIYTKWFDHFLENAKINGFIYLKTNPYLCSERINKRSRKGEEQIPLEYLQSCNDYHERWLETENKLVIDGTPEYTTDVLNDVHDFIFNFV